MLTSTSQHRRNVNAIVKGLLNGLQSKIKSTAPQAMFIHCYAHRLNLVLQDAVGELPEVKIFFATLSGISVFFFKINKTYKRSE
jgi:hypothetical protein